jgi:hypothetical protein
VHDELPVNIGPAHGCSKPARSEALLKSRRASGLFAVLLIGAFAQTAASAERNPLLEVMQAQCIQEAMLRGFVGEALKGYVNTCVELKRKAPPPDPGLFSADPAVC